MISAVPMWGSEVAKSKTEVHLTNTASEVTWACDVTTIIKENCVLEGWVGGVSTLHLILTSCEEEADLTPSEY